MPLFSDYASTRKTVLQKTVNKPVHRRIQGGARPLRNLNVYAGKMAKWRIL